jgi:lysozyme family protein
MPTSFDIIISKVLDNEGSIVTSDPLDKGGISKYGISSKEFPSVDIINLTRAQATQIYYKDYWVPYPFDKITNCELQAKLFDTAVNMGHPQAFKLLQRSLLAFGITIPEDGILGPTTLQAANANSSVLTALRCECAGFYRLVAAKDPTQSKFLTGWLRRAYS